MRELSFDFTYEKVGIHLVCVMKIIDITTEPIKGGVPSIFDWYENGQLVEIPVWVVTDE